MSLPHTLLSTLYGPGAFTCWLCTLLSVLISQTYNLHSRALDVLTGDLFLALIYPSIAALHFQAEFWDTRNSDHDAEFLDAEYCIVVWFSAIAPWLLGLAAVAQNPVRWSYMAVVSVLCVWALWTMGTKRSGVEEVVATRGAFLPVYCVALLGFSLFYFTYMHIRRASAVDKRWRPEWYNSAQSWAMLFLSLMISLLDLRAGVLCAGFYRTSAVEEGSGRVRMVDMLCIPRTGCSMKELYQVLLLGFGVVVVLDSIWQAQLSIWLADW